MSVIEHPRVATAWLDRRRLYDRLGVTGGCLKAKQGRGAIYRIEVETRPDGFGAFVLTRTPPQTVGGATVFAYAINRDGFRWPPQEPGLFFPRYREAAEDEAIRVPSGQWIYWQCTMPVLVHMTTRGLWGGYQLPYDAADVWPPKETP